MRLRDRARIVVVVDNSTGSDLHIGIAAGLAGPNNDFELVALFVSPLYRGQGLGAALLDQLEASFALSGARLGAHFSLIAGDGGNQRIVNERLRFLLFRGWGKPVATKIVCHTRLAKAFRTPWLIQAQLPQRYGIGAWQEVRHTARFSIEAGLGNWVPPLLNPYSLDKDFEPATSVALVDKRDGNRVCGWIITHRLDANCIRWTCSFVAPGLQGVGRVLPLWLDSARRQRAMQGPQKLVFTVGTDSPRMQRFALRRMRPYLDQLDAIYVTTKRISGRPNKVTR